MSRLQRSSLRAVVIFIISLSLIDSPVSSLRIGQAASHSRQASAASYNATGSNLVAVSMFFRRIIAWFQGGSNLSTMRLNALNLPMLISRQVHCLPRVTTIPDPSIQGISAVT